MFVTAMDEVAGDADVENAISSVTHEVNITGLHEPDLSKAWMAGTSPAMTA
jgi:hypothetical protein